jgi:hypothetical protein
LSWQIDFQCFCNRCWPAALARRALKSHDPLDRQEDQALGEYLLKQRRGEQKIHAMIVEDIRDALGRGDRKHARELFGALRHFLETHHEHVRPGRSA